MTDNFQKTRQCRIREYMKDLLYKYNTIRGKSLKNLEIRFWDAVIFSASDLNQRTAYEKQIIEKQKKKEIPLDVPFHIFSDKPGFKNGCGGSTMYVLEKLFEIYGSSLFEMRLLFVPAGGFSQRLPSLTVLGKLFCPLPFGNSFYQMIDLVLATYLPFLENMSPGIFLASSDAIISYYVSQNDEWTFKNEGFTALAHPSSLDIGVGHGVYVLSTNTQDFQKETFMSDCMKVLQKPTKEEMFENGAVVNFPLGGNGAAEIVFSDSAFFFDQNIALKLIDFYKKSQPLKCELSSYGDFLQPLGSHAEPPAKTLTNKMDDLLIARSSLYKTLHGSKLNVLVLNESQFHHLGTIPEYIDSFCFKNEFSQAFPMQRFSFSAFSVQGLCRDKVCGTVMHSVIHPMTSLPSTSVLEYCNFGIPMDIGDNCLISNCKYGCQLENGSSFKIPDNILLHTVCLEESYVTIACGVFDDIKKSYRKEEAFCMRFCDKELNALFVSRIDNIFNEDLESISLWNARIFIPCSSMEESFKTTLKLVAGTANENRVVLNSVSAEHDITRISMEDILKLKDVEDMLHFQQELYQKILKFQEK